MYLMRVIKNFGTRELILMGVELPWIFLFNHCYCKIADLVRRKGRFETKKQKDVRHDGRLKLTKASPDHATAQLVKTYTAIFR